MGTRDPHPPGFAELGKPRPPIPTAGPDFERDFREWEVEGRKRLAVPMLVICGVLTLLLGVLDLRFLGGEGIPGQTVLVRFFLAGFSGVAAWRVYFTDRPGVVDAWIFGWSMTIVMALVARHVLVGDELQPMHHALDVALTILWLLCTNPIQLQLVPSLLTAGSGLTTSWGGAHPATLLGAYVLALAGGVIVAWERDRTSRSRFRAVREIRTLRGIVPICAACKQIRDDDGYWHRVEEYVRMNTEAEFTHGMCPGCVQEYYGLTDEQVDALMMWERGGAP
jgi:hypothetical protein